METNTEDILDNFNEKKVIRRKLLPVWIKVFCWIFMFSAIAVITCFISWFFGFSPLLAFYGFETTQAFSLIGILLILLTLYKGVVAYFLWFEIDNAIILGKIDAITGIIICLFSMLILPLIQEKASFTFRLEIIFLILFYIRLNKIEYEWDNLEKQESD